MSVAIRHALRDATDGRVLGSVPQPPLRFDPKARPFALMLVLGLPSRGIQAGKPIAILRRQNTGITARLPRRGGQGSGFVTKLTSIGTQDAVGKDNMAQVSFQRQVRVNLRVFLATVRVYPWTSQRLHRPDLPCGNHAILRFVSINDLRVIKMRQYYG